VTDVSQIGRAVLELARLIAFMITTTKQPAREEIAGSFDRKSLASHVLLSVRTLDRLAAQGLLPPADLTISGSKRWLKSTISRWLAGKPKLSGRKGGRS
jgi:hypothetical protein